MPTITVKIANSGHPINGGFSKSTFGHMWISLPGGGSVGYSDGGLVYNDNEAYDPGYFSQDFEVTPSN